MEFISIQKYVVTTPRKIRLLADLVRKMPPGKAVENLPYIGRRASFPLIKVINSAIANAKQKGVSPDDLSFKEIQVNEGPRLKRGLPISRGRWHPFKKRMSHIRVVLTTEKSEKSIAGARNERKDTQEKSVKALKAKTLNLTKKTNKKEVVKKGK